MNIEESEVGVDCFEEHDALGQVCAHDATEDEAYCTLDAEGSMVCARAVGGGRCAEGDTPPPLSAAKKEAKLIALDEHNKEEM